MGLAEYKPSQTAVTFKGGSVNVRGLSFDDCVVLFKTHLVDINKIFEIIADSTADDVKIKQTAKIALDMAREAPALVAHIIAVASDEPDQIDQARKLLMPVQTKILKEIAQLTFEEAGGAKNFFASLKSMTAMFVPQQTTGSRT